MGIQERKEREKERRRQQIMVAAKRVFVEKGFGRATMEDIANEAELSAGTIYLYFKNKDELYASMSLRMLQYLYIRIEHLHNENLNPHEKISQLSKALLDVYEFDPLILKNLLHLQSSDAIKNLSAEFLQEFKDMVRRALGKIAAIFSQGIEAGICAHHDPQTIADIVWSLFTGIVLWETSKMTGDQQKDLLKHKLEMAFEILERGLLVKEKALV
jgi:AcrR family transcriptional regulator